MTNDKLIEALRDAADWHAGRHVARLATQAADRLEALTQPSGKVSDEQVRAGVFRAITALPNDAVGILNKKPFGVTLESVVRSILEAAQLPARPVVKALKWKIASGRHEHSHSIFGDHFAYDDGSWTSPENHHMRSNGSLESAKKEAQADYERRILSALEGEGRE